MELEILKIIKKLKTLKNHNLEDFILSYDKYNIPLTIDELIDICNRISELGQVVQDCSSSVQASPKKVNKKASKKVNKEENIEPNDEILSRSIHTNLKNYWVIIKKLNQNSIDFEETDDGTITVFYKKGSPEEEILKNVR